MAEGPWLFNTRHCRRAAHRPSRVHEPLVQFQPDGFDRLPCPTARRARRGGKQREARNGQQGPTESSVHTASDRRGGHCQLALIALAPLPFLPYPLVQAQLRKQQQKQKPKQSTRDEKRSRAGPSVEPRSQRFTQASSLSLRKQASKRLIFS